MLLWSSYSILSQRQLHQGDVPQNCSSDNKRFDVHDSVFPFSWRSPRHLSQWHKQKMDQGHHLSPKPPLLPSSFTLHYLSSHKAHPLLPIKPWQCRWQQLDLETKDRGAVLLQSDSLLPSGTARTYCQQVANQLLSKLDAWHHTLKENILDETLTNYHKR